MYGMLWRVLPGPSWMRAILFILSLLIFLTVVAFWVFPWLNGIINYRSTELVTDGFRASHEISAPASTAESNAPSTSTLPGR